MNFKKLSQIKGVKVEVIITGPNEEMRNIYDAIGDGERWPDNVFVNTLTGEAAEEVLNEVYKCIPGRLDDK